MSETDVTNLGDQAVRNIFVEGIAGGNQGVGIDRDLTLKAQNNTGTASTSLTFHHATTPTLTFSTPSQIKNVALPTVSTDVATKEYVDANVQGLLIKEPAHLSSVEAMPTTSFGSGILTVNISSVSSVGIITSSLITFDGVAISVTAPLHDRRILIKDQTNAIENGIYILSGVNQGASTITLTRAQDFNEDANAGGHDEVRIGAYVFIEGGTNGGQAWTLSSTDEASKHPVVDVNTLVFSQFSGSGGGGGTTYTAGNAIDLTNDEIAVKHKGLVGVDTDQLHLKSSTNAGEILISSGTETTDPTYGVSVGRDNALVNVNPMSTSGTGLHNNEEAGGGIALKQPMTNVGDYSSALYFGDAALDGTQRMISQKTNNGIVMLIQSHDVTNSQWKTICVFSN